MSLTLTLSRAGAVAVRRPVPAVVVRVPTRSRRTATAPARLRVSVKLTRKLRAALKRYPRRDTKIRVQVTFTPVDGTRAVVRTISIVLKP